jgi:hypothetical protein
MSTTIHEGDEDNAEEITISNKGTDVNEPVAVVDSHKLYSPLSIEGMILYMLVYTWNESESVVCILRHSSPDFAKLAAWSLQPAKVPDTGRKCHACSKWYIY